MLAVVDDNGDICNLMSDDADETHKNGTSSSSGTCICCWSHAFEAVRDASHSYQKETAPEWRQFQSIALQI